MFKFISSVISSEVWPGFPIYPTSTSLSDTFTPPTLIYLYWHRSRPTTFYLFSDPSTTQRFIEGTRPLCFVAEHTLLGSFEEK